MSTEDTQNLPGAQSFESRVLTALADITQRLERLEAKQYDTKPIWSQALAEISEVRVEMQEFRDEVRRNFATLSGDLLNVRSEQRRADERLRKLEVPHS